MPISTQRDGEPEPANDVENKGIGPRVGEDTFPEVKGPGDTPGNGAAAAP